MHSSGVCGHDDHRINQEPKKRNIGENAPEERDG